MQTWCIEALTPQHKEQAEGGQPEQTDDEQAIQANHTRPPSYLYALRDSVVIHGAEAEVENGPRDPDCGEEMLSMNTCRRETSELG